MNDETEKNDTYWQGYFDALRNDQSDEFWYQVCVMGLVFASGIFFGWAGAGL